MTSKGISRWLPGLSTAQQYRRAWLWPDVRAGIVVTALLIPAGMGYAEVAGLPPVTGLYATIVPLLAYAVFGPSRVLVLGPDSSLAPIMAGALLIIGGLVRLGFVTDLLSKPIRVGYLNAIAVIVIVSQLPKLLGFSVEAPSLWRGAVATGEGIVGGSVDPVAAAFGIGSLVVIFALKA